MPTPGGLSSGMILSILPRRYTSTCSTVREQWSGAPSLPRHADRSARGLPSIPRTRYNDDNRGLLEMVKPKLGQTAWGMATASGTADADRSADRQPRRSDWAESYAQEQWNRPHPHPR